MNTPDTAPIAGVPRDYRIALPDGWHRIPLEHGKRERAISDLIGQQFAGLDNLPRLKSRLRQHLADQAEAAWRVGGIELYLSLMSAGPIPLAASLVITLVSPPPGGPVQPHALAAVCVSPGRTAEQRKLPAGSAIFVRGRLADVSAETRPTNLEVHVQVPGSGAWLLLSFATPVEQLAEPMLTLFEAIVATLRWID
jgi:hypothetical protein